jgi:thiol-disulfide isomerase/thioredoxin
LGKLLAVSFTLLMMIPAPGQGVSQTSAPPSPLPGVPQLSPEAAYDQAVRPLDIVRKSMDNWSDSELAAFSVAAHRASGECSVRTPQQFSGDDLISYAKLCSLGQNWSAMGAAASLYIDSRDALKPQLATAYGYKLESELHAQDVPAIMAVEKAMLAVLPYEAIADTVTNEAVTYLEFAYTKEALAIDGLRQPLLLAELKSDKPALTRHILYGDGLAKASLEQYAGQPAAAAATVAELDAALAAAGELQADDAIPIAVLRQQYGLLGKPLPAINFELSLLDVREKPHINPDFGAATALVLFPDWCAQCVRTAPQIWDAMTRLGEDDIRVYGLVAEAMPDKAALLVDQMKPMGPPPDAPPKTPSELLLHMPVLVVPPETVSAFAAQDFPFLIVVDHAGLVRFAEPVASTLLQADGVLDRVVMHVTEQWPRRKVGVR